MPGKGAWKRRGWCELPWGGAAAAAAPQPAGAPPPSQNRDALSAALLAHVEKTLGSADRHVALSAAARARLAAAAGAGEPDAAAAAAAVAAAGAGAASEADDSSVLAVTTAATSSDGTPGGSRALSLARVARAAAAASGTPAHLVAPATPRGAAASGAATAAVASRRRTPDAPEEPAKALERAGLLDLLSFIGRTWARALGSTHPLISLAVRFDPRASRALRAMLLIVDIITILFFSVFF
jgi:hypothetical protein